MNAISVAAIALAIINAIVWYRLGKARTVARIVKILMKYTDDICSIDPNTLSTDEECLEQLGCVAVLNKITREVDQEFFGNQKEGERRWLKA